MIHWLEMPRQAARLYWSVSLVIMLTIAGCFPSSFELSADKVAIEDEDFVLVYDGVFREEGEALVMGRSISYQVDNYAGVWTNGDGITLALVTTPSVVSMTMEANPVANMNSRQLVRTVLETITEHFDPLIPDLDDDDVILRDERFARVSTSLGAFTGSLFAITAADESGEVIVLREQHGEDLLVILVLASQENGSQTLEVIERALETLQHSSESPDEEGLDGDERAEAS